MRNLKRFILFGLLIISGISLTLSVRAEPSESKVYVNDAGHFWGTNYCKIPSRSYKVRVFYDVSAYFTSGQISVDPAYFKYTVNSQVTSFQVHAGNSPYKGSFIVPAFSEVTIEMNSGLAHGYLLNTWQLEASYQVEFYRDNDKPDTPQLKINGAQKINGNFYTASKVNLIWDGVQDNPKSFNDYYEASGIMGYQLKSNDYGNNYYDYSIERNIAISEGVHQFQLNAYDFEYNFSDPSYLKVYSDQTPPSFPATNIITNISHTSDGNVQELNINWLAATDSLLKDGNKGSGVAKYLYQYCIYNDNATNWSSENTVTHDSTITQYSQSIPISTDTHQYVKVRVKAVDAVGNASDWNEIGPIAIAPEQCSLSFDGSLAEERDGLPQYSVALRLGKVDAVNYVISRKALHNSTTSTESVVLKPGDLVMLSDGSYQFQDKKGLEKHGVYQYEVYTTNILGEQSPVNSCTVNIANIAPDRNKIYYSIQGPRRKSVTTGVNFILGTKMDFEGDMLEYRLYTRKGGVENLAATWQPTADNQQVSATFADQTDCQWQIRCLESDSKITDRQEVAVSGWLNLAIDTTKPLPVCINEVGELNYGTKNQPLKFRAEASPNAGFVKYLWDFGDGSATVEGTEVVHIYNKLTANTPLTVKVTAFDQAGNQYQDTINLEIRNTTKGRLYDNETWSGSTVLEGEVQVPLGYKLILEPGADIQAQKDSSLLIKGELYAVDPDQTIMFDLQGCQPDNATGPNSWAGINFIEQGFGTINGVMQFSQAKQCISSNGYGRIDLDNIAFFGLVDNTGIGLGCYGGNVTIDGCYLANLEYGIKAGNNRSPLITNCNFDNNKYDYQDCNGQIVTDLNIPPNSGNTSSKEGAAK